MISKVLALITTVFMLFSIASCSGNDSKELTADYDDVKSAIFAFQKGEDMSGKTIKLKATNDCTAGLIYFKADTSVMANIYVTVFCDESKEDELFGIKEGDMVVVKVKYIDDHLKRGIYIYADDFQT